MAKTIFYLACWGIGNIYSFHYRKKWLEVELAYICFWLDLSLSGLPNICMVTVAHRLNSAKFSFSQYSILKRFSQWGLGGWVDGWGQISKYLLNWESCITHTKEIISYLKRNMLRVASGTETYFPEQIAEAHFKYWHTISTKPSKKTNTYTSKLTPICDCLNTGHIRHFQGMKHKKNDI